MKVPLQSEAQIIGDAGELWFQTTLPPGWIAQRPTRDVGVDFVVVICEPGSLNGREFRVQVKTSKEFVVTNDAVTIAGLKRSTVDYWFISPLPTMLAAYDQSLRRGYYCWHSDFYEQMDKLQTDADQQTMSVRIPVTNELQPKAWERIREALLWHSRNLRDALRQARNARSVLPTVHALAAAARQLNSVGNQPIPKAHRTPKQEELLALIELIQHRAVVTAASQLLADLQPGSVGAVHVGAWIDEYRAAVLGVFPTFDRLAAGDRVPPDFELAYARNLVEAHRPKFVETVLQLVMLLTANGDTDAPSGTDTGANPPPPTGAADG